MSFLSSWFLWIEAVVAASALAAACAFVGVYMIVRRVVFLPAAISQVAGLGVAIAFLLGTLVPSMEGLFNPALFAMGFAVLGALGLGWLPEPKNLSREAVIGVAYILASALVLLVGNYVPKEAHDIKDILFGNAVAVERGQMWTALGLSAVVLVLHLAMRRQFLMVSFDRETARAHGVPVAMVDGLLFFSLGLSAAQATRTIGAMPVFAFSVLPAAAALRLTERINLVFLLAVIFGVVSAFLGYWLSFVLSLPTGSCMAAVTGLVWLVSAVAVWLLKVVEGS